MNVCVIIFNKNGSRKLDETARSLAQGIEAGGHRVDLIDGLKEQGKKISFYDYIAIGTDATGLFGGTIPQQVSEFLSGCGTVTGKRSFAFITKGGVRKHKTLKALMDRMEHEGMYLKFSEIIPNHQSALEIGKRLHIG